MQWKGKIYALPYKGHSGTSLIWYNKQMLAGAGVTGDLKLNSYDELVTLAKKLTKDTNGRRQDRPVGLRYAGHTGWELLGPMRGAGVDLVEPRYGATKSLLNGEKQMQVISWIHDLIHVHKVHTPPRQRGPGADFCGRPAGDAQQLSHRLRRTRRPSATSSPSGSPPCLTARRASSPGSITLTRWP